MESLSPPAGGSRLRGGRSYADSAKGASPFGIPSTACGREEQEGISVVKNIALREIKNGIHKAPKMVKSHGYLFAL
ncbi:hypothetical protein D3Z52_14175 [Clostridiaceae bacterium]|nr:hypothetical protein [Clostridiaceae bacterium]